MKPLTALMLSLALAAGINGVCVAQTGIVGNDSGSVHTFPISYPQAKVTTDRSAYEPGDTVYFTVQRAGTDYLSQGNTRPASADLSVTLIDPSGNVIQQYPWNVQTLNPTICFGTIPLAENALPGEYTLRVEDVEAVGLGDISTTFIVQEPVSDVWMN